jgi:hypothetical protein
VDPPSPPPPPDVGYPPRAPDNLPGPRALVSSGWSALARPLSATARGRTLRTWPQASTFSKRGSRTGERTARPSREPPCATPPTGLPSRPPPAQPPPPLPPPPRCDRFVATAPVLWCEQGVVFFGHRGRFLFFPANFLAGLLTAVLPPIPLDIKTALPRRSRCRSRRRCRRRCGCPMLGDR